MLHMLENRVDQAVLLVNLGALNDIWAAQGAHKCHFIDSIFLLLGVVLLLRSLEDPHIVCCGNGFIALIVPGGSSLN